MGRKNHRMLPVMDRRVVAGVALALALGVPLGTLLVVAAILACPVAMYFGMRAMGSQQESGPAEMRRHAEDPDPQSTPKEYERETR